IAPVNVYDAWSAITIPVKAAMKRASGRESTPILAICTATSRPQVATSPAARVAAAANFPNRPNAAARSIADRPTHASRALHPCIISAKIAELRQFCPPRRPPGPSLANEVRTADCVASRRGGAADEQRKEARRTAARAAPYRARRPRVPEALGGYPQAGRRAARCGLPPRLRLPRALRGPAVP